MSRKYVSEAKAKNVAQIIGPRLIEQHKAPLAADIYKNASMIRECVDAYIYALDFENARRVAEQFQPDLLAYIEECHQNRAKIDGRWDDMEPVKALELYANSERWEEGLKLAEKQVT